jgi:alkanesulfonate monooxygenase SsuD/methylene tetrahydromethanopterin reductase-like flavin-dependent oxidoreductase (luciferase family)
MRIGVVLPTFAPTAADALGAAAEAEGSGLHGVFAYDHLWPMGHPGRPALSPYPVLGAIAARTSGLRLGTLVARVGLAPDAVVLEELLSLDALSGGRLVAGVGTGDAKSAAENFAYGVAFAPAAERRASVTGVVAGLLSAGVPAWVGGGSAATNAVARATGAALNLWAADPVAVAVAAKEGEVTWGGVLPEEPAAAAALLYELALAGATWAVVNWPGSCAPVAAAASTAGVLLG